MPLEENGASFVQSEGRLTACRAAPCARGARETSADPRGAVGAWRPFLRPSGSPLTQGSLPRSTYRHISDMVL